MDVACIKRTLFSVRPRVYNIYLYVHIMRVHSIWAGDSNSEKDVQVAAETSETSTRKNAYDAAFEARDLKHAPKRASREIVHANIVNHTPQLV